MTPETLSASAAILLSLLSLICQDWRNGMPLKPPVYKRLFMLGALLAICLAVLAMACTGWGVAFSVSVACTKDGAALLIRCFVLALAANQAAFLISPKASSDGATQ